MEKDSKWYVSIQKLYNVAQKYGDLPITSETDDNITKIYYDVKAIAEKETPFVRELLLAFVNEKRREVKKND